MTTILPQPRESVYQLSEDLRDEAVFLGVRPAPPSEAEREELLFSKLGPKGWVRLHHFRHFYSAGWGDGSGKPLSPRALETFYRFLEFAAFTGHTKPSVFLTDQGCIELCWEDASGKAVQLEFRPTEIEFYTESQNSEGTVPNSAVAELASRLAGI
jgi:hypothetical protein